MATIFFVPARRAKPTKAMFTPWCFIRRIRVILAWIYLLQLVAAHPQILGLNTLPGVLPPSTCSDGTGTIYNNASILNSGNRQVQVLCGINLIELELVAQITPSLNVCVDLCIGNPYCVFATYDKTLRRCSLKGKLGVLALVNNIVTGVVGSLVQLSSVIGLLPLRPPVSSIPSISVSKTLITSQTPLPIPPILPTTLALPSAIASVLSTQKTVMIPQLLSDVAVSGVSLDLPALASTILNNLPVQASIEAGVDIATPTLLPDLVGPSPAVENLLDLLETLGVATIPAGLITPLSPTSVPSTSLKVSALTSTLQPQWAYDIDALLNYLSIDFGITFPRATLASLGFTVLPTPPPSSANLPPSAKSSNSSPI